MRVLLIAILIVCVTLSASAQAEPPVEVARLGRGAVEQIAFAPDGDSLAVATRLGVWWLHPTWGQSGPTAERLLDGQTGALSAAIAPDGARIAGGGADGSVLIWDAAGNVIARLDGHLYGVGAVAWAHDGTRLASGDASGIVRVWAVDGWSESAVYPLPQAIAALAFTPDGDALNVELTSEPLNLDLATGAIRYQRGVLGPYIAPLFALNRDRAAWLEGSTLRITHAGREVGLVMDFFPPLTGLAPSVITGAAFDQVARDGFSAGPHLPGQPVTSPDGTRIAQAGGDSVIRVRDAASGEEIAGFFGHIRTVNAIAFSPDGRWLASASSDGTVRLWDATATGEQRAVFVLTGHHGGVTAVAFSADGTRLASAGFDGTLRIWQR